MRLPITVMAGRARFARCPGHPRYPALPWIPGIAPGMTTAGLLEQSSGRRTSRRHSALDFQVLRQDRGKRPGQPRKPFDIKQ
jgi:hypothetical protein